MTQPEIKPVSPLAKKLLQQVMEKQMREAQEVASTILADAGLDPQEWGVDFQKFTFVSQTPQG